jgi:AraC-like DNA-binding protein
MDPPCTGRWKIRPLESQAIPSGRVVRVHTGAALNFCSERTVVKRLSAHNLSSIEKQVLAEIRALRASAGEGFPGTILQNPARTIHHFIFDTHGNAQLRISTIARELGVGMRTLQRTFKSEYRKTTLDCQMEARLSFARWLLGVFPPEKISAIASILGYERVQDFNRFFKKHTHQSPTEWARIERARTVNEGRLEGKQ